MSWILYRFLDFGDYNNVKYNNDNNKIKIIINIVGGQVNYKLFAPLPRCIQGPLY